MSRKNRLTSFPALVNSPTTAAVVNSAVSNTGGLDSIAYQVNSTAGSNGNLHLQTSVDYAQDFMGNVTNPGNWVTIGANTSLLGLANSFFMAYPVNFAGPWVRLQFTQASGTQTGVLNAFLTAKMV